MKLLYIANIRIPTEKAHGIQIMKMCEAFTNLKIDKIIFISDNNKKVLLLETYDF